MAVREKMALAAMGEARSKRPGIIEMKVEKTMARSGVPVILELCPKYPPSGRPSSDE